MYDNKTCFFCPFKRSNLFRLDDCNSWDTASSVQLGGRKTIKKWICELEGGNVLNYVFLCTKKLFFYIPLSKTQSKTFLIECLKISKQNFFKRRKKSITRYKTKMQKIAAQGIFLHLMLLFRVLLPFRMNHFLISLSLVWIFVFKFWAVSNPLPWKHLSPRCPFMVCSVG